MIFKDQNIITLILLYVELKDFKNLITLNKYFKQVIYSRIFWKLKLKESFNIDSSYYNAFNCYFYECNNIEICDVENTFIDQYNTQKSRPKSVCVYKNLYSELNNIKKYITYDIKYEIDQFSACLLNKIYYCYGKYIIINNLKNMENLYDSLKYSEVNYLNCNCSRCDSDIHCNDCSCYRCIFELFFEIAKYLSKRSPLLQFIINLTNENINEEYLKSISNDIKNNKYFSPILFSLKQKLNLEILELLINNGFKFNIFDICKASRINIQYLELFSNKLTAYEKNNEEHIKEIRLSKKNNYDNQSLIHIINDDNKFIIASLFDKLNVIGCVYTEKESNIDIKITKENMSVVKNLITKGFLSESEDMVQYIIENHFPKKNNFIINNYIKNELILKCLFDRTDIIGKVYRYNKFNIDIKITEYSIDFIKKIMVDEFDFDSIYMVNEFIKICIIQKLIIPKQFKSINKNILNFNPIDLFFDDCSANKIENLLFLCKLDLKPSKYTTKEITNIIIKHSNHYYYYANDLINIGLIDFDFIMDHYYKSTNYDLIRRIVKKYDNFKKYYKKLFSLNHDVINSMIFEIIDKKNFSIDYLFEKNLVLTINEYDGNMTDIVYTINAKINLNIDTYQLIKNYYIHSNSSYEYQLIEILLDYEYNIEINIHIVDMINDIFDDKIEKIIINKFDKALKNNKLDFVEKILEIIFHCDTDLKYIEAISGYYEESESIELFKFTFNDTKLYFTFDEYLCLININDLNDAHITFICDAIYNHIEEDQIKELIEIALEEKINLNLKSKKKYFDNYYTILELAKVMDKNEIVNIILNFNL